MSVDRISKLLLLGWLCTALLVDAWLIPGGLNLHWVVAVFVATAALLTSRFPSTVSFIVLPACLFPGLIRVLYGGYHVSYDLLWLGLLVGALLPGAVRSAWHIPTVWRVPLMTWAMVIVISATIVAAREADFYRALIFEGRMPWESLGGDVPRFDANWVLQVAVAQVAGIVWFDWLFGLEADRFERGVALPMAAGALAMMLAAVYQLFVDIHWLNDNVYGFLGRATGTLFDGNAMAAAAGMWIAGLVLVARRLGRFAAAAQIVAVTSAWLAVWASGSRTGLAVSLLVTIGVVVELVGSRQRRRRVHPAVIALVALAAVAALVIAAKVGTARGPMGRIAELFLTRTPGEVVTELWIRNGYGRHAASMIGDHRWVGVGIGAFHLLISDYAALANDLATADNAQNWYRHQLAELGIIGSLPWIAWVLLFAWFVLRHLRTRSPGVVPLGAALIGLAAVSLVGMPSQLFTVAMTFWTFAFWFVRTSGAAPPVTAVRPIVWVATGLLVVGFTIGTVRVARSSLRPPVRAALMQRDYSYGVYPPEPDGAGGAQYWTRARSARLIEPTGEWLDVTVRVNHSDLATNPVHARVWVDGQRLLDTTLRDATPLTRRVWIGQRSRKVLLDTWVNRVVWPPDLGVNDRRELGLLVSWNFVANETRR